MGCSTTAGCARTNHAASARVAQLRTFEFGGHIHYPSSAGCFVGVAAAVTVMSIHQVIPSELPKRLNLAVLLVITITVEGGGSQYGGPIKAVSR